MLQYALQRILHTIPVLFGVLMVTFLLLYVTPGDPVMAMVGDRFDAAAPSPRRSWAADRADYVCRPIPPVEATGETTLRYRIQIRY